MYLGAAEVAFIVCHIGMSGSRSGPVMRRVWYERISAARLVPGYYQYGHYTKESILLEYVPISICVVMANLHIALDIV